MKILILSPPSLHKTLHFGGTGVKETRYTKTMVPCQVPLTLPAEIMSGTRKCLGLGRSRIYVGIGHLKLEIVW